jgi:hypothetical protein
VGNVTELACVRSPDALEAIRAVPPTLNPTVMSQLEGPPVVRSPGQLRLHHALQGLGWTGAVDELNDAARLTNPSVKPILITPNGTILAGFGRCRFAVFEHKHEIHCIEYPLSEDESLSSYFSTIKRGAGGMHLFASAWRFRSSTISAKE